MKKAILLVSILISVFSCQEKKVEIIPNDSIKISGLMAHKDRSLNAIELIGRGKKDVILVNPDGTFSKKLKFKGKGFYTLYDGKNKIIVYLNGGDNITVLYDYENPDNLLEFKGKGAETNNFLKNRIKFEKENSLYNAKKLYALSKEKFDEKVAFFKQEIDKMLSDDKIDRELLDRYKKEYDRVLLRLKQGYKNNHLNKTATIKGKPSPTFSFENFKGGKTSLDDLKGNYVYIDVWATWCGPCKQQIPYLKKLEEAFKNKPIKFVSISVDDARRNGGSWEKAKEKWRNFVKENKLGGIQLFADKGWESDFIKQYGIRGIPRFILLDKEGKIMNPNMQRPSQEITKTILRSLK